MTTSYFCCLRVCASRPIGQALTADPLQGGIRALRIIHPERGPIVVAKIEFANVALQMRFANMVICPDQATLEDREKALYGVRRDFAARVFFAAMVHAGMLREF